ncbi:MAG: hypothetical protein K9I74_12290 [Bacteroidales bacterium]|nr:hypothetical protein [Bacteroidales bacterium]
MALKDRVGIYKEIEAIREGRPLVVYVTSLRPGATGNMAGDVIPEIIDQIQKVPEDNTEIDLFIESTGGDPLVSWRIITLLRERFTKITALIPYCAYSAATLLSLGCDEILMGRYGSLGPTDPQINVTRKDGSRESFAYQDIVSYLGFVKDKAQLTEQAYVKDAFNALCSQIEPSVLGASRRSSKLSIVIGQKLLETHMTGADEKNQAANIAKNLNESYFSHGHALGRKEAKEIGLKIKTPDPDLENKMWDVHRDIEADLQVRESYDPLSFFFSVKGTEKYLQSPPPLHIPPQANPQQVQTEISKYINQQLQFQAPEVENTLKYALVESQRYASCFEVKNKILVSRLPDLQFQCKQVAIDTGWKVKEF